MSRKAVPAFANSSLQKRFALAVRVVVLKVRNGYLGLMKTYVDIRGASGGAYRFQNVAALSKMPASAGNFVLVSDLVDSDCNVLRVSVELGPGALGKHLPGSRKPSGVRAAQYQQVRSGERA